MGSNSSTTIHAPNYYKRETIKDIKKLEPILKRTDNQKEKTHKQQSYPNRKSNSHQQLRMKMAHPQTATRSSPSLFYGLGSDGPLPTIPHQPHYSRETQEYYHYDQYDENASPKRSQSPRFGKRSHPQLSPIHNHSNSNNFPTQQYNHSNTMQYDEFDMFGRRGSASSETSLTSTASSVVSYTPSLTGLIPAFQAHPPIISLLNRSNSVKRSHVHPHQPQSPSYLSNSHKHASHSKKTTLLSDAPFTISQMMNQQVELPPVAHTYKRSSSTASSLQKSKVNRSASVSAFNSTFRTSASISSLLNPKADVEVPLLAVTRPETPPCTTNIHPSASMAEFPSKYYLSV